MILSRMGIFQWPLTVCFLMVAVLTVWAAVQLLRDGATPTLRTKAWIDAVRVWGFLAFLVGLTGASVGMIFALQGAERAGTMASPEAARGLVIATITPSLGTMVFALAVFVWFVLQLRWRLLRANLSGLVSPHLELDAT